MSREARKSYGFEKLAQHPESLLHKKNTKNNVKTINYGIPRVENNPLTTYASILESLSKKAIMDIEACFPAYKHCAAMIALRHTLLECLKNSADAGSTQFCIEARIVHDQLRISVIDNGKKALPTEKQGIYDPLLALKNPSEKKGNKRALGGHGLGLMTAANFLEKDDTGYLLLEQNQSGKGVCVTFVSNTTDILTEECLITDTEINPEDNPISRVEHEYFATAGVSHAERAITRIYDDLIARQPDTPAGKEEEARLNEERNMLLARHTAHNKEIRRDGLSGAAYDLDESGTSDADAFIKRMSMSMNTLDKDSPYLADQQSSGNFLHHSTASAGTEESGSFSLPWGNLGLLARRRMSEQNAAISATKSAAEGATNKPDTGSVSSPQ